MKLSTEAFDLVVDEERKQILLVSKDAEYKIRLKNLEVAE